MSEVPSLEVVPQEELGYDELRAEGRSSREVDAGDRVRAPAGGSVSTQRASRRASRSSSPTSCAPAASTLDRRPRALRARRRSKNAAELAGHPPRAAAAEAATAAVAAILRAAEVDGERVLLEGEPLTSERLKEARRGGLRRNGAQRRRVHRRPRPADVHRPSLGLGRDPRRRADHVDLWPRDRESACFTDMTRTFVVGEVNEELRLYHDLCKVALERVARRDPARAPMPTSTARLRGVRGGGAADAALEGARRGAARRLLPLARARRRAGGARGAAPRPERRGCSSRATSSRSSRAATARDSAACGWRISCSSPRTAAELLTTTPTSSSRDAISASAVAARRGPLRRGVARGVPHPVGLRRLAEAIARWPTGSSAAAHDVRPRRAHRGRRATGRC